MHVTRKLLRTAAAWLASAVVAVSILAPIGQFFISLADERGLYQHPSARVAAMINALAIVVGSPWFHWIGGGIVGFAIGVWVDGTLKRRDETVSASGKGAAPFPRPIPGDLAMTAPQSEYVHLNDVCGMIYGKLGSCFLRTLIDGRSAANDSILDSMGGIISNYTDVYGVRPPAQTIEKIDHEELRALEIVSGARSAREVGTDHKRTIYEFLCIQRSDIARITDAIMNVRHNSTLQFR